MQGDSARRWRVVWVVTKRVTSENEAPPIYELMEQVHFIMTYNCKVCNEMEQLTTCRSKKKFRFIS